MISHVVTSKSIPPQFQIHLTNFVTIIQTNTDTLSIHNHVIFLILEKVTVLTAPPSASHCAKYNANFFKCTNYFHNDLYSLPQVISVSRLIVMMSTTSQCSVYITASSSNLVLNSWIKGFVKFCFLNL